MTRTLAALLCVALAGCATTGPDLPPPVTPAPCVSVAVEPEPVGPVLTDAQQLALDRATIAALGPTLAAAVVLYREVTHPEWGRRSAAGLDAMRAQCAER